MHLADQLVFVLYWIVLPTLFAFIIVLYLHYRPGFRDFVVAVFSDAGNPSFGRIASFIALVAVISWVTRIVWRTETIPDLWNCTMFIAVLYSISKAPDIMAAIRGFRLPEEKKKDAPAT